jgi:hypothetical protein
MNAARALNSKVNWSSAHARCSAGASIHAVDLKTGHVSVVPGSEGMWPPRWSPDGRFIAGLLASSGKVVLYDFRTQKQSELSSLHGSYRGWSHDGESLFYTTFDQGE